MSCSNCGHANSRETRFCTECGSSLAEPSSPGSVSGPALTTPAIEARPYAGFWARFLATVIDGILINILAFCVIWLVSLRVPGGFMLNLFAFGAEIQVMVFVCQWLYEAVFLSSVWQATIGRRVMHIRVTAMQGSRISFARATGRFFAKYLSSLPLLAGYLIQPFTRHQQTLHDMLSNCVVVDHGSGSHGGMTTISIGSPH